MSRYMECPKVHAGVTLHFTCANLARLGRFDLDTIEDNNRQAFDRSEDLRARHDAAAMLVKVTKERMKREAREVRGVISEAKGKLRRMRIPK